MKKIVRLTESELKNIIENSVRRAIKEGEIDEYGWKDFRNDAAFGLGLAGAMGGAMAGNVYLHDDEDVNQDQIEMNQAVANEFGTPQGKLPNDTIGWKDAKMGRRLKNKIAKSVTESIQKLMRECKG